MFVDYKPAFLTGGAAAKFTRFRSRGVGHRTNQMNLLVILSMLMLIIPIAAASESVTRPNFILIMADDLDFDYKQDRLTVMPHLLSVRDSGAQFLNHVAAHPVCGPSRSSYLAGRYPHNTGYKFNGQPF